jgi:hypothetical protein
MDLSAVVEILTVLLSSQWADKAAAWASSVAEPHHFFAAPAPGKNFDAAAAPTLLYSRQNF